MLAGKEFPRAMKSGVNLIEDKEDFVLIANLPEHVQKIAGRSDLSAASLDGLHQNASDFPLPDRGDDLAAQLLQAWRGAVGKRRALQPEPIAAIERTSITMRVGKLHAKAADCARKGVRK